MTNLIIKIGDDYAPYVIENVVIKDCAHRDMVRKSFEFAFEKIFASVEVLFSDEYREEEQKQEIDELFDLFGRHLTKEQIRHFYKIFFSVLDTKIYLEHLTSAISSYATLDCNNIEYDGCVLISPIESDYWLDGFDTREKALEFCTEYGIKVKEM